MATTTSHSFHFANGKIHYLKAGDGSKLLVAIHGYGNDASMFLPLRAFLNEEYTLVCIDLPHHGESFWDENTLFSMEDMRLLLDELMKENGVKKISLLGYSMGGRVCLSLLENMPEVMEHCVLVASDGLVFNLFYFFATHTSLGKVLLQRFVNHPQNYIRLIKWLRKRKWLDVARFTFMMNYVNSKEERAFLNKVWPSMSLFIPYNKKKIERIVMKHHISITIFSGDYDRIIPPKHALKFKQVVSSCRLVMLEKGHRIFDSVTWKKISDSL